MRAEPLGYNAFATERTGVPKDGSAIAGEMLVKRQTVVNASEEIGELLLAVLQRRSTPSSSTRSKAQSTAASS
jgi:hypothetical protein